MINNDKITLKYNENYYKLNNKFNFNNYISILIESFDITTTQEEFINSSEYKELYNACKEYYVNDFENKFNQLIRKIFDNLFYLQKLHNEEEKSKSIVINKFETEKFNLLSAQKNKVIQIESLLKNENHYKKILKLREQLENAKQNVEMVNCYDINSEPNTKNSKLVKDLVNIQNNYLKSLKKFNHEKNRLFFKYKKTALDVQNKMKLLTDKYKFNTLPVEQKNEKKTDCLFYVPNTLGYWLTILISIFEIIYLIICLNYFAKTWYVGCFILFNICVLLLVFSSALKLKVYSKVNAYMILALGIYNYSIRILLNNIIGKLNQASSSIQILIYLMTGIILVLSIIIFIDAKKKIAKRDKYIAEGKINKVQLSK